MCLSRLKKFTTNPKRVGYKVYRIATPKGYRGINYHFGKPYQLGRSYTAKTTDASEGKINTGQWDRKANRYIKYKAGFHVYDTLKLAKRRISDSANCKIVEVKYNKKDILATGLNSGRTVILKKMTLVREIKRKAERIGF